MKMTIPVFVSLLMVGLTIPNLAWAENKMAADPAAHPEFPEIALTGKLLLVPVAKGQQSVVKDQERGRLSVHVNGHLVHDLEIHLAQAKEDIQWWAALDMSKYVGKQAVLAMSTPADRAGVALIESSDQEPLCA